MTADLVQRQRRKCGPKVKTGCSTCKIRRVKCDEARPSCQRCASTGRRCDGYTSDILISKQESKDSALIQRISTHITGNTEEKRGFHYFLQNTAAELSGYFDSSFWESLILAASTQEPALRHTVIAIGGLHEAFSMKKQVLYPDASTADEGTEFALVQYSKALKTLRLSLSSGKQEPLTALMSCILFVCFDSLRGHFESAMVHLQSGLRILQDIMLENSKSDHIIEDNIAPLFVRLSVQAIIYVDTISIPDRRAFAHSLIAIACHEMAIPEEFETLEEARRGLNQAANGLFQMFDMCDGDLPLGFQPAETFELFEKYNAQLQSWNLAYEKFMAAKGRSLTSKEVRGAALLKIHHTAAKVLAGVRPDPNDLSALASAVNSSEKFLEFVDDFNIIINLSKSLIAAAEQDALNGKPPLTFSTDLGLIGPLYYVCVKSPFASQRQIAIELLKKCPRREGMWNSVAIAKMIEEFWALEAMHKAGDVKDEFGFELPLGRHYHLNFLDGMNWEWVYKGPQRGEVATSQFSWLDDLQGERLFGMKWH